MHNGFRWGTAGDISKATTTGTSSDKSIIEVGCWAHVRCQFFELHVAAKSTLAEVALAPIGALYTR